MPLALMYALILLARRDLNPRGSGFRILKGGGMACVALLLFCALLRSNSKMGFISCLGALFVMAALALGSAVHGWKRLAAVAGLIALFLCAFIVVPPVELAGAFGGLLSNDWATLEGRWPIWLNTLQLIRAYPIFGCGLGGYQSAFLKYQSAGIDNTFDYAHNDYLQLGAELGAVGCLILAGFTLQILIHVVRAALRGPDQRTRYLALGCLGGMVSIGLHSLTDFNLYIPANAVVLAWIAGIASGLPVPSKTEAADRRAIAPVFPRGFAIAFGVLLTVYAAAWIRFQSNFRSDPRAEQAFCRFGICAADIIPDEPARTGEKTPAARTAALLEWLRRDPTNPLRWSDLGVALWKSGEMERAGYCFSNALALGPEVPPVLLQAAEFYHKVHEDQRSRQQTARVLAMTDSYDRFIFTSYAAEDFTLSEILRQGLPAGRRAAQAYFDYVADGGDVESTSKVWDWLVAQGYSDDRRFNAYLSLLIKNERYDSAAQLWSLGLGNRRNGYRQSTWIYDGDFETEGSDSPFDWAIRSVSGVQVTRDKAIAHSGIQSLRIEFQGTENVSYEHTSQIAVLPPGAYRFQAYVQTKEITTDQGIGFRLSDPDGHSLNILTEPLTGTSGWRKVEQAVCVTPRMRRLDIRLVRRASWKFDNKISGTAWIDSVELVRAGEACSMRSGSAGTTNLDHPSHAAEN